MRLFQEQREYGQSTRQGAAGWIVVLCLVLLTLLTAAQVAHVHQSESDPAHCPICMALQTAAPVSAAGAAIVLVSLGFRKPRYVRVEVRTACRGRLFIRPPPIAS